MGRLLLAFWRLYAALLILTTAMVWLWFLYPEKSHLLDGFGLAITVTAGMLHAASWFWVAKGKWDSHTRQGSRVVLYSAVSLRGRWDFQGLLETCATELNDLSNQFGFQLGRQVLVYILPSGKDIADRLFPRSCGFSMLANAIFIPADGNLTHALRHQLTHLFSARLNALAPPLLREGLSTWFEGPNDRSPLDMSAREVLRHREGLDLSRLLRNKFFYAEENLHDCYSVAGSFSSFLILHFGWETYLRFFRKAANRRFAKAFSKHFRTSFDAAQEQWRQRVLS